MSLCPESDAGFMRLAADAPNDDEEDLTPSQQRRYRSILEPARHGWCRFWRALD
jgi:hypothetical protein